MGKISDYDLSKQDVNVQDTHDDIKTILNLGNYEIKVTSQSYPNWTEKVNGILVLSIFGASKILFISETSAPNGWVYATLTDL